VDFGGSGFKKKKNKIKTNNNNLGGFAEYIYWRTISSNKRPPISFGISPKSKIIGPLHPNFFLFPENDGDITKKNTLNLFLNFVRSKQEAGFVDLVFGNGGVVDFEGDAEVDTELLRIVCEVLGMFMILKKGIF
jgi:hypothetical protein